MLHKNVGKFLIGAAAIYAVIFVYQRYQRKKANESIVSYQQAIEKLDSLD